MTKRVFIIHGWGGSPNKGWFPWLKKELEHHDFSVTVPAMPDTEHPIIEKWVSFLKEVVGSADEETFFVGHSIGCQTIVRYLESLPQKVRIGGVVFVAGWVTLKKLSDEEEKIVKPWLEKKIEWNTVKQRAKKFVAIFSDNDEWVPLSDSAVFKKELGAMIVIEHNKGHFGAGDVETIPVVLENFLEIT